MRRQPTPRRQPIIRAHRRNDTLDLVSAGIYRHSMELNLLSAQLSALSDALADLNDPKYQRLQSSLDAAAARVALAEQDLGMADLAYHALFK